MTEEAVVAGSARGSLGGDGVLGREIAEEDGLVVSSGAAQGGEIEDLVVVVDVGAQDVEDSRAGRYAGSGGVLTADADDIEHAGLGARVNLEDDDVEGLGDVIAREINGGGLDAVDADAELVAGGHCSASGEGEGDLKIAVHLVDGEDGFEVAGGIGRSVHRLRTV